MNEYEEISKEVFGVKPAEATSPEGYDSLIGGIDELRKQSLQQAGAVASTVDPSRAAKVKELSDKTRLPFDVVDKHYDTLAKSERDNAFDYDTLLKTAPKTSEWLSNPDNARVAMHEAETLAGFEREAVKYSTAMRAYEGLNMGLYNMMSGIAKTPAFVTDVASASFNLTTDALGVPEVRARYAPEWLRDNPVTQYLDKQAEMWTPPEMSASELKLIKNGEFSELARTLAVKVAANAPNMLTAIMGNYLGSLTGAAGIALPAGANKYAENLKQGVDPDIAPLSGAVEGTVEAVSEQLGTLPFLKTIGKQLTKEAGPLAAKEILKEFGGILAQGALGEGGEEVFATAGQRVADYALGVDDKALDNLGEEFFNSFMVGGASGGALGSAGAATLGLQRMRQASQAKQAKDLYKAMGQSVEAMKLREQLPEDARKYVEHVLKDGPVENIYISPEALEGSVLFQGANATAELQKMGILELYQQAKESGADVKIPMSLWTEKVAGTPAYQAMADDIKFDPDTPSVNELKEERKRDSQKLEQAAQEAEAAFKKEQESRAEARAIGASVAEQLKAVGHSEKAAIFWEQFFGTLAQRHQQAGANVTPNQLFALYRGQIQGPAPVSDPNDDILFQSGDDQKNNKFIDASEVFKKRAKEAKDNPTPQAQPGEVAEFETTRESRERLRKAKSTGEPFIDSLLEQAGEEKTKARREAVQKVFDEAGKPELMGDFLKLVKEIGADIDNPAVADTPEDYGDAAKKFLTDPYFGGKRQFIRYTTPQGHVWVGQGKKRNSDEVNFFVGSSKEEAKANSEANRAITTPEDAFNLMNPEHEFANAELVVGTSVAMRNEMPFFVLQEYDIYMLTVPGTKKLGAVMMDRMGNRRNLFISTEVTDVTQAMKHLGQIATAAAAMDRGGIDSMTAKSEPVEKNDSFKKKELWLTNWIYRRPKAALREKIGEGQTLFQSAIRPSPIGFYSAVEKAVADINFESMPAKDLANRLQNMQGLKKDELENLGLIPWLLVKDAESQSGPITTYEVGYVESDGRFNATGFSNFKEDAERMAAQTPEYEVREIVDKNDGRVTKEEVLEFIRDNGLKLQQVVYAEDYDNSITRDEDGDELPSAQSLDWNDGEQMDSDPDGSLQSDEYHYYTTEYEIEDQFEKDWKKFLEASGITEEEFKGKTYGDKQWLREEFVEVPENDHIREWAEKAAHDSVHGPDSVWAIHRYTERETGWTLEGNDEHGWYSEELREHIYGSIEEAKIQLIPYMIKEGVVQGRVSDLITREKITFHVSGETPSWKTVQKKAKALFKKDKARLIDKVLSGDEGDYYKRVENFENEEKRVKDLELAAEGEARSEINASYKDPTNARNQVTVTLGHPLLDGYKIRGNNKKGFRLLQDDNVLYEGFATTPTSTLEDVQNEALDWLKSNKVIETSDPTPTAESNEVMGPVNPNEPTKEANFSSSTIPNGENYREFILTVPRHAGHFTVAAHWGGLKNPLVHIRVTDRIVDGKKTLFIEEAQSDWTQEGREKGYKGELITELPQGYTVKEEETGFGHRKWFVYDTDGHAFVTGASSKEQAIKAAILDLNHDAGTVDPPPMKTTDAVLTLAMKRMIHLAVQEGYDSVAWAAGETHAQRWGTDVVSWVKKTSNTFDLIDASGQKVLGSFPTKELALKERNPGMHQSVREPGTYWLMGAVDQRGGNAGMDIEAEARARGLQLERSGERVTNKDELRKLLRSVLSRNHGERSLESLTNQIWAEMQVKDSHVRRPREEGLKYVYDTILTKKVVPPILKKLDKSVPVKPIEIDAGETDQTRKYIGPEVNTDTLHRIALTSDFSWKRSQIASLIRAIEQNPGASFASLAEHELSAEAARAIGGEIEITTHKKPRAAFGFDLTEELKNKAAEGFTLYQPPVDEKDKRAMIELKQKEAIIRLGQLGKQSDHSSFIHESGHYFFEVMKHVAALPETPQAIKDDYQTLLTWMGTEPGTKPTVEQLEKFARGFEAYVMEGKAPSTRLKKAFQTFRAWMLKIYQAIQDSLKTEAEQQAAIGQRLNVQLSDDVRAVMDRMLATDAEIEAAKGKTPTQPMIDPATFGMGEEAAARYNKAREDAQRFAEEELSRRLMADLKRKQKSDYIAKRREVETEMRKQLNEDRGQRALAALQKGTRPNGQPLPADMPAVKLDPKSVESALSANGKSELELPRGITTKAGGFPVQVVAEGLGYGSAIELLEDLAKTKPYRQAVKEQTDDMMRALYPELFGTPRVSEEAIAALHNDGRAQMLQLELEYLQKKAPGVYRDVIRRTVRRPVSIQNIRERAALIVGRQVVRDIRPAVYQKAEVKAAREAGEALAKGDFDAAAAAKERELLNHELFRAAKQAREELSQSKELFRKFFRSNEDLAKTRDMDLISAGRAILAHYGVGTSDKSPIEHLKAIMDYAPEAYAAVEPIVVAATQKRGPHNELAYEDFQALQLAMQTLWDLSGSLRTMEIDGRRVEDERAIEEMSANISERVTQGKGEYAKSADKWEKNRHWLLSARAAMTRVESWVVVMDKGEQGALHTYLFNPVKKATTEYRLAKRDYMKKYLELTKKLVADNGGQLSTEKIAAPELMTRQADGSYKPFQFEGKAQLLGMLLHVGNDSNKSKLLRGYGWGQLNPDGTLDSEKFDAFISRMHREGILTKADYDFVQGVWDLFEELKPQAQRAHKAMYGFFFNEITANEVVTPFGTYRGGYAPAKADPYFNEDAAIRKEQEGLSAGFAFPTTGRGATKNRIEAYAAPLQINLGLVAGHVDWALRFAHIEPAVANARRLLWDRKFRAQLTALDPVVRAELLVPWLDRAAKQSTDIPSMSKFGRGIDRFARALRRNSAAAIMVGNFINTVEQIFSLSPLLLKVKRRDLRNALFTYMRNPRRFAESVEEKSAFMQTRMKQQASEMQKEIEDLLLDPSKYDQLKDFSQKHAYFMQRGFQNLLDIIAWDAAYNQAVEKKLSEPEAVLEADSIMRQVMGSSAPEDVSRIETGYAFARLFMMFWGYFNLQLNLLGAEALNIPQEWGAKKKAGRGFFIYFFGFMIPAVMGGLLRAAAMNDLDADDDDEYVDDLLGMFFGSQARYGAAMFPVAGQALVAIMNQFNNQKWDDRVSLSPVVGAIERPLGVVREGAKLFTDEEVNAKRLGSDLLSMISLFSGVPVSIADRPFKYLMDVESGRAQPTGPIDFTRGLLTGKSPEQ